MLETISSYIYFLSSILFQLVCEDQGYFLEIADIIRRLGLSIFRGVMESQETKIWARFIVEVHVKVASFRVDKFYEMQTLDSTANIWYLLWFSG